MHFAAFLQLLDRGAPTVLENFLLRMESRSLKSLRLCSKTICNLVLPYLFTGQDALFISAHPLDLDIFEAVLNNPDLRLRVQKTVWDDTTFDPRLLEHEVWEKNRP